MTRIVMVPGCLALLPEYASLTDPVADLRRACEAAVEWLGRGPEVLATEQGARVAAHLLHGRKRHVGLSEPSVLVVANGSGRRSEKAPGAFDERAAGFDAELRDALIRSDPGKMTGVDQRLARELWASVEVLPRLAEQFGGEPLTATVDYDDAPFGVQYWVIRWS